MAEVVRWLDDPPVEVVLSLLIPYAAYLPAEQLGLSGVLAVVTPGSSSGGGSARSCRRAAASCG